MKIVTGELVAQVSAGARQSTRLRTNYNLHRSDESQCHRLINAIEPGSYVRPHRHLDPEKDEGYVVMRGRLGVVTFTDDGTVAEAVQLSPAGDALAVDIPHGVYHTALGLEPGTVFYETKAGPYRKLSEDEMAVWAPEEGSPQIQVYLKRLSDLFD